MTFAWVTDENRARTNAYRKDEDLERSLVEINEALAAYEPEIPEHLRPLPHLFVFGLPRSGTTLTHQVLTWGLDLGYVTNVMARFWLAPHAGATVSKAAVGDERDGSFASDYGKSLGPAGGHEFAYFWQEVLGVREFADLLNFSGDSDRADWGRAAAAVRRIQAVFDKALVFKTNYAAQFLPAFARTFPMPLFVHVSRDPLDVALSILEGRRHYYGTVTTWWATHPPEYEALVTRSPAEQIAGQVVGLQRAYSAQIAKAPAELTLEFSYERLCEDPRAVVEALRNRCRIVHGTVPDLLHPLPDHFDRRPRRTPASEEEDAVAEALERALAEESV